MGTFLRKESVLFVGRRGGDYVVDELEEIGVIHNM